MRRALALASIVAAVLAAPLRGEVLFFEDFEGDLSQWETPEYNLLEAPAGSIYLTDETAFGGTRCATFGHPTYFGDSFSRPIPVTPGETYYLHIAYMTQSEEGGGAVGINMFSGDVWEMPFREHWMLGNDYYGDYWILGDTDGDGFADWYEEIQPHEGVEVLWAYNDYNHDPGLLGTWAQYTATYVVPEGVQQIQVKVEQTNGTPGIYYDNIEWSTEPTPTPGASLSALIARVNSLAAAGVLNRGNTNALLAKLEAAQAAIERGNVRAATGQLGAFVNQVKALGRNRLDAGTAAGLAATAEAVIASLAGGVGKPAAAGVEAASWGTVKAEIR